MTATTETDPNVWTLAFQGRRDEADPKWMADHMAAMAQAYLAAYSDYLAQPREALTRQGLREATAAYFYPAYAAFTASALLRGWSTERVNAAVEAGDLMAEWLWTWLAEADLSEDTINALAVLP